MPVKKRNTIIHDWRHLFTAEELEQAKKFLDDGKYRDFTISGNSAYAFVGWSTSAHRPAIYMSPIAYSTGWRREWLDCTCSRFAKRRGTYYADYFMEEKHCSHTAALLMLWEKEHGPWYFEETDEEKEARLAREEAERERERLERIRDEEYEKRARQKEKEGDKIYPVGSFLEENGGFRKNLFFDIKKAAFSVKTNRYAANRAKKLLPHNADKPVETYIIYGDDGEQQLKAEMTVEDEVVTGRSNEVSITVSRTGVEKHECDCKPRRVYWGSAFSRVAQENELCEHELVLLSRIKDYVNENNPGDATDKAAIRFFEAMDEAPVVQEVALNQEKSVRNDLFLSPLITVEQKRPYLTFRLGEHGSRPLLLKKLNDFSEAYEKKQLYSLGKLQIDFSERDFDDESRPWLNFVMQKVDDADKASNRISGRSWYSYSPRVSVQNKELLEGAVLDRFYDLAEGSTCELSDKAVRSGTCNIVIGHKAMNVSISTKKITDSSGELIGVELFSRV